MTTLYAVLVEICRKLYGRLPALLEAAAASFVFTPFVNRIIASAQSSSTASLAQAPTPRTGRGVQHSVSHAPVLGPFHPHPPQADDEYILSPVYSFIDNVAKPVMEVFWRAMSVAPSLAGKANHVLSRPYLIETFVLPIKRRVRQTIAQIPVPHLPSPSLPSRFVDPVLVQLALFETLVGILGVPIPLAGLLCFVACVTLFVGDRMGIIGGDSVGPEADSTPEMAGVGHAAVLNG